MPEILDFDDFIIYILYNENASIEIDARTDGQQTGPGGTVEVVFIYRGGIGTGRAGAFNIFVFDRSDTTLVGTAETPESNLPQVFGILPVVPLAGGPRLTLLQISQLNAGNIISGIFAQLVGGKWQAHWTGSFKVTSPLAGSGVGDINQDTTFTGQAQIVR